MCNSVLHHLAEPRNLLAGDGPCGQARRGHSAARFSAPGTLRVSVSRPLARPPLLRRHARLYRIPFARLTPFRELQALLDSSPLQGARVFVHHSTHIGIERPANFTV